jgi:hypothetical protein
MAVQAAAELRGMHPAAQVRVSKRIITHMPAITPNEAAAYLNRWKLVEQIELIELRRTSMEVKLRQLSALMASRDLFGVDPERENGVQLVRDRWACLRQALRG